MVPLPVVPEPVVPLPVVPEPCMVPWVLPLLVEDPCEVVYDEPCEVLPPVDPEPVVVLGLPPEFVVCACALKAARAITIAPNNTFFFITVSRFIKFLLTLYDNPVL